MSKKAILFTRPNHDWETSCLHYLSNKLLEEIQKIGEFILINLEGPKATRKIFEEGMSQSKPRLVILNGHGSENSVCGYKDEIILDKNNINLLDSKIIYSIACESAQELGEIAVDKGKADAYIGYEGKFMIVIDPSRSATPAKDKNIIVFVKPYTATILSLISGLTVEEAIENTKKELRDLIRKYGVYGIRDKYGDAPLIRYALFWDLCFLKAHGNLSSVV